MRTLSQQSLNDLIFGRIFVIIAAQIILLVFAVTAGKLSAQDLDIATIVNICAIMSCVAMMNATRKGFNSILQNVLILLFDSLYVFLLIRISGGASSPFIIMLPLYIFFSSLSLGTPGTIFSTLLSVLLVTIQLAAIIIIFATLCDYIVRRDRRRKKALEEEKRLNALHKNELLDSVVSILAHEIKNPVSSLAGVADLIRSDEKMLDNPDQRQKMLGIIERETNRLANLTEEFLIYSGSEKRRNERIELNALMQICCENVRTHKDLTDKQISLEFNPKNGPYITYGDFHRLEQVFTNILVNSVHACAKGGKIVCTVYSSERDIFVCISNNGEQIPQLLLERIFDPFFTTKERGTGLGLAIAKNIIKAHDGDINVESSPEETSFKMRFKLWQ